MTLRIYLMQYKIKVVNYSTESPCECLQMQLKFYVSRIDQTLLQNIKLLPENI
jgi:hypothetical protein